jgi:hypothetical protein
MWSRWRRRKAKDEPAAGLETCKLCGLDYVNPVDWEPLDEAGWWMLLRCAECETYREAIVADADAERFDSELNRRADVLARALHRIERQEMLADVEMLTMALRRGLIDAADFAR